MTTFYAIKKPSPYGDSFVRASGDDYKGMGPCPTLFSRKERAETVIANYKWISKNSGKPASTLEIIEVEIG